MVEPPRQGMVVLVVVEVALELTYLMVAMAELVVVEVAIPALVLVAQV